MPLAGLPCFKAYDVRGKVPTELNRNIAYKTGRAVVEFLSAKQVVVGHDIRLSSSELCAALIGGITDSGADALCIGLCGTEMVYFATSHLNAGGGIMITASHNPPEYNGMKLVRERSLPISGDSGLDEIGQRILANNFNPPGGKGKVVEHSVLEEYIQHLLKSVNPKALAPLKVIANAGNGCAGPVVDAIEKHLPIEIIKIQNEPDGTFPNGVPNPMLAQNRAPTRDAVRQHKASLGVAWDGDFDRCFFFDENGEYVEGYYVVGLLAEIMLKKEPGGAVIYDPRLYWNTVELVNELGGKPVQWKTGHAFIKEKMRAENAVYGGEMSCHHYFRDFFYCDSGMVPWLLLMELLTQKQTTLSELVSERMNRYPVSGEINFEVENPDCVIQSIEEFYQNQNPVIERVDGIGYEFPDWRFNVRKSNTEPILRLNIETRGNAGLVQEKLEEMKGLIQP